VFKRLFWLVFGFMLGIASSWAVTRRVRRVMQRLAPADVVDRWSDNVKSAVSEGRSAMRMREVELNSDFDRATGQ
jgi:sensor histidine kinase regulating citrate/malate metabolism